MYISAESIRNREYIRNPVSLVAIIAIVAIVAMFSIVAVAILVFLTACCTAISLNKRE